MDKYELTATCERQKDVTTVNVEPLQANHVRYLKRPTSELILDTLLGIIPWLFIALAIAARAMHNTPISRTGARIQSALILGPTVFPIIFAGLCGHFMKSLALYKSQTGLRMKHLEHLVGAQSIFSSFERLFFLRNYSAIGIVITLTWCVSPLGGQGFVRMLDPLPDIHRYQQNITYLTPKILEFTNIGGFSGALDALLKAGAIYSAAISSPQSVRESARDVWGNPKIPAFSSLIGPLTQNPKSVDFTNGTAGSYLSLIGIPVGNLTDDIESQFEVESINLNVTCVSNINITLQGFTDNLSGPLWSGSLYDSDGTQNVTVGWQKYADELQLGTPNSFIYAYNNSVNSFLSNTSDSFEIFYGSSIGVKYGAEYNEDRENDASVTQCYVMPVRLRSAVTCQGRQCYVAEVRRVPTDLTENHQRTLVDVILDGSLPGTLCGADAPSTWTAYFLAEPGSAFSIRTEQVPAQILPVPLKVLSERMSLVLNTWYYATTSTLWAASMDTIQQDWQTAHADLIATGDYPSWPQYLENATAQVEAPLGLRYKCHMQWFAIALVSSIILAAIAVANIVARFLTKVPDVFGYASSLTLHNELCRENGLARSTALDGLERAAELRNVKFRIADVRSDSDVGRMAFVPVWTDGSDEQSHGEVKLGRLYD